MDQFRRIIFALAVFFAAFFVFAMWRGSRPGYGLLDLLQGRKPAAESFTAPAAPKLSLDDVQVLAKLNDESAKLASVVLPCVVSVSTKTVVPGRRYWNPFYGGIVQGRSTLATGLGSGAFISKEGHIVTNFHVIDGVTEVQIVTNEGKKLPARVIGANQQRDVALLKVDDAKTEFPALSFANSDEARVGQIVFAVGNPFGLTGTVTQGIISARNRHLSDSAVDYLQTDTVINPGNSGGPLVNIKGEILGINVAIFQGGENTGAWQGVGLAIPGNEARAVIDDIRSQAGTAATGMGYLGLTLSDQLVRIDAALGVGTIGALIQEVAPGSPAEIAGLQADDVILDFGGKRFRDPNDIFAAIRQMRPGTQVNITVLRNGRTAVITSTLGQRPQTR
ncbi:MAG: trypsin-like peptidase domain-containing protein [Verrucomicrobiaceae bacterium]|nr:trypsin-like peptidase domain-containing protein [Verrucomicrobiaceae bacterium]